MEDFRHSSVNILVFFCWLTLKLGLSDVFKEYLSIQWKITHQIPCQLFLEQNLAKIGDFGHVKSLVKMVNFHSKQLPIV